MPELLTSDGVKLVDSFADLRVLVVGDVMLDSYLEGDAGRICREAPVPVINLSRRLDVPGGAANTAANACGLGAAVVLLAVVGDDAEGVLLRQALAGFGVDDQLIVSPGRATLVKHRLVAASQLLVRFDQGSTTAIDEATEQALITRLAALWTQSDAVIVSDYDYGVLSPRVIVALRQLQREHPRTLVVDARRLDAYRDVAVSAVKPNYDEALRLLGIPAVDSSARVAAMAAYGPQLLERTGARIVALTLDTDGALLFEGDDAPYRTATKPTLHARATGAGDTFVATLALALAGGAPTALAGQAAAAAAAVVVGSVGTVVCRAAELREALGGTTSALDTIGSLVVLLERYRQQGRRVVFTNGCFDILHRAHITYLKEARALGDVLVVGLNTDAGISRIKGPGRPINTLDDRVQVLAALGCVDHVVAFGDDTPHALIAAIRPDVFVKGGDYTRAALPEAALVEQLGGEVHILPYIEDQATSSLLERIRQAAPEGAYAREVGASC